MTIRTYEIDTACLNQFFSQVKLEPIGLGREIQNMPRTCHIADGLIADLILKTSKEAVKEINKEELVISKK